MGNRCLKYQNLSAFEKHLQQAAKVQLSRVFLIVSSCPYERKLINEKIFVAIRFKQQNLSHVMEDAAQGTVEERIANLNTSPLFSGTQMVYLDNIDKLKKNGLALLADYIVHPSPFAYLVLGASAGKGLADLYAKGKKEVIVCDLSEEKPWDRKERFKRYLIDKAMKAGKRWHGDAVDSLIENIGLNLPSLDQELGKLITYSGDKGELTLRDVQMLCAVQKSSSLWQLVEMIVWKEEPPRIEEIVDLSLLLPLLSQMRVQLQHGMLLAVLLERGAAHAEISRYLPTIKPSTLQKMLPVAKARRLGFFKKALDQLFEIELMAKNSSFEPGLILDLFLAKITLLKKNHALSIPQSSR